MLGSIKVCTNNFISSYESIKSFRKYYPDSSLVLLSNIKEYDLFNIELSKIFKADCILYKQSLDYPSYLTTDENAMEKIISHIENVLKASLFIKEKYFLYQEPDYFMMDKVDVTNRNEDFITNFRYVAKIFPYSMNWVSDINQQNNFLNELSTSRLLNFNYSVDELNSIIYTYAPGNIIKTEFSKKLYYKFDDIKLFLKKFDNLVKKHFNVYTYNLDFILSLVSFLFYPSKGHYEPLIFYFNIDNNNFYDIDIINERLKKSLLENSLDGPNIHSIHGIKLLYNNNLKNK